MTQKSTFSLLFLLLAVLSSNAQIIYESSDFLNAGDEFRLSTVNGDGGFDFTQAGENQVWNYADLTFNAQQDDTWIDPAGAGYQFSWCLANSIFFGCADAFQEFTDVAQIDAEGIEVQGFGLSNIVTHYKKTDDAFASKMIGAEVTLMGFTLPVSSEFSNVDTLYGFPLAYQNSDVSAGEYTLDFSDFGLPVALNVQTERSNTVEGYGSLMTPFGEFPEVLKVKTVLLSTNTVTVNGMEIPTEVTTVEYKWFDKNYGIPVLTATGNISAAGENILNVAYLDTVQCVEPTSLFFSTPNEVFADPDDLDAEVTFENLSQNGDTYLWDFGDGNTSAAENPVHTYDCPGDYEVTLTTTNSACTADENGESSLTLDVNVQDTVGFEVTQLTGGLEVSTADAAYQWVDCDDNNSPITGATEQQFFPAITGNYAVILQRGGCTDISECVNVVVSSVENLRAAGIEIFPNPTQGKLYLTNENAGEHLEVQVYNARGEQVFRQQISGNATIDLPQNAGVYFVKITNAGEVIGVRKVILR